MRIKNYDYDTVVKLKNPLRDFKTVLKFVEDCFTLTEENVNVDELVLEYELGKINCFYDVDERCLCFFYNTKHNYGFCFYEVYEDRIITLKKNCELLFEELKDIFLKYKLKEKLDKELKVNQVVKRKVNKI